MHQLNAETSTAELHRYQLPQDDLAHYSGRPARRQDAQQRRILEATYETRTRANSELDNYRTLKSTHPWTESGRGSQSDTCGYKVTPKHSASRDWVRRLVSPFRMQLHSRSWIELDQECIEFLRGCLRVRYGQGRVIVDHHIRNIRTSGRPAYS